MTQAPKTKIVAAFGKRVWISPKVDVPPKVDKGTRDATSEFASELTLNDSSSELTLKDSNAAPRVDRRFVAGIALGVVAIALITAGVYWKDRWQVPADAAGGSLRIESDPAGAEVRLNGAAKGKTPLSLSVPTGSYSLSVRNGSNIKELPVSVTNGATTVHHITWADTPALAPAETGSLSVATEPPGGRAGAAPPRR